MTKYKKTILRLCVPKLNERGPMAFEQILASLHGLLLKSKKKYGEESVSFEIVRISGKIYFYVVVPSHLRTLLSSQLYAQYPEVEIETVQEYFTKKLIQDKKVLVATLRPAEPQVFPFKRYPQFMDQNARIFEDPLGPITAALSHLHSKTDTAILQVVVAPIAPSWNSPAQKTLRRFFKNGPWKWDWYRHLYEWARIAPEKSTRIKRAPIWGLLNLLFGWGGAPKIISAENRSNDDDDSQLDRESQTSSRHDRETVFSAAYDKLSRLNFATNIRAIYIHSDSEELHAEAKIREIAGTFQQFSLPQINHFRISTLANNQKSEAFRNIIHRRQNKPFALSQEELATMYHLPTVSVSSPAIQWVFSRKIEPPVDLPDEKEAEVTLIGSTNFRQNRQKYGIRPIDRQRHVYIIGKTGMGKSTLLDV